MCLAAYLDVCGISGFAKLVKVCDFLFDNLGFFLAVGESRSDSASPGGDDTTRCLDTTISTQFDAAAAAYLDGREADVVDELRVGVQFGEQLRLLLEDERPLERLEHEAARLRARRAAHAHRHVPRHLLDALRRRHPGELRGRRRGG